MKYRKHPIAARFPELTSHQKEAIYREIQANPNNPPEVFLYEGMILDGYARAEAAERANVDPAYKDLPASTDPHDYLMAHNIRRRHLTKGQIAAIYVLWGLDAQWKKDTVQGRAWKLGVSKRLLERALTIGKQDALMLEKVINSTDEDGEANFSLNQAEGCVPKKSKPKSALEADPIEPTPSPDEEPADLGEVKAQELEKSTMDLVDAVSAIMNAVAEGSEPTEEQRTQWRSQASVLLRAAEVSPPVAVEAA